jgi:phage I-like protein
MDEIDGHAVSYHAVPLPAILGTSQPAASSSDSALQSSLPQSAAAQRLAQLKSKLGAARQQNHKAVVAEDRRTKLGEAGLKEERIQRAYEAKQKARAESGGGEATEVEQHLEITAEAAAERLYKAEKKGKAAAGGAH